MRQLQCFHVCWAEQVTSVERDWLPPTDARLRPDQRALEEGRVAEAESVKLGLEQAQRDRRRQREHGQVGCPALAGPALLLPQLEPHKPVWFHCLESDQQEASHEEVEAVIDNWKYGGQYWESRSCGFDGIKFEPLW